jgi:hypothetical protein
MRTIVLHVSDESADAIADYAKVTTQVTAGVRAQVAQLLAVHPRDCGNPLCAMQMMIDAGQRKLSVLESVERFHQDVVTSFKCATVVDES